MIWLCGIPIVLIILVLVWTILKSGSDADELTARILRNEKNRNHPDRKQ